jgi:hypothetical protein
MKSTVPLTEDRSDRKLTHPGMASWGGGGPEGKTCRECQHWDAGGTGRVLYFVRGMLKPQQCLLAARCMQIDTPKVPFYALACKEFVLNPDPPAPIKQRDPNK